LRVDGKIGSALDANVAIFVDQQNYSLLEKLGEELRFLLITSQASLATLDQADEQAVQSDISGVKISVNALEYQKCVRCWHRRADVGSHAQHPELCGRCISNVDGGGETRFHV